MSVRMTADPDVGPGRRDRELPDSRALLFGPHPFPFCVDVLESAPAPPPADAGLRAVNAFQSCHEAQSFPFFDRGIAGTHNIPQADGTEGATLMKDLNARDAKL